MKVIIELEHDDLIGCYKGKFFGIECKAGKNTATALQVKNLSDISLAGGVAVIINETNMDSTPSIISSGNWYQKRLSDGEVAETWQTDH